MPKQKKPKAAKDPLDVGPPPDAVVVTLDPNQALAHAAEEYMAHDLAQRVDHGGPAPGFENVTADDLLFPYLKLSSQMSKGEGKEVENGHWWLSGDPQGAAAQRVIVVLGLEKGRSFVAPYEDEEKAEHIKQRILTDTGIGIPAGHKGPYCSSPNRVEPRDQGFGVLNPTCKGCRYAVARQVGSSRVLDCRESYRIPILDITPDETGAPMRMPAIYNARGAAIKAVKNMNTALQIASRGGRRPSYDFSLTVESREVTNERDETYFVPFFGRPQELKDEALKADCEMLRQSMVKP